MYLAWDFVTRMRFLKNLMGQYIYPIVGGSGNFAWIYNGQKIRSKFRIKSKVPQCKSRQLMRHLSLPTKLIIYV
jgi:hypothetical protein